ncbi:HAD family hydrolase [Candidatus Enterococcus lemimoniae]|uniref:HAD family hydrolase n=1 Tax=Candidatus Enterococcus lemimoniae TaxID=1834167 RepID=UPI000A368057|nr:HAD hydrolase-like protein [Enterococcus sp. 12C11_DIV0727]
MSGKKLCKPSNYLIEVAIEKLKKLTNNNDKLRIIGIGNSEYDIMAYNKSGIESVLVNWGNRSNCQNQFNADYVYAEVVELIKFLKKE